MYVTPSGRSASITALVTAALAAIVPASPTPLTPNELTGDGVTVRSVSIARQLGGGGQRVVDERAGDELALLVVVHALVERLADGVHDAAVHLTVDQHRVDRVAAVVDGDVAEQLDLPGLWIEVDDRRVRAEREHEVLGLPERRRLETRLHALGDPVEVGGAGHFGERHALIGRALDRELVAR